MGCGFTSERGSARRASRRYLEVLFQASAESEKTPRRCSNRTLERCAQPCDTHRQERHPLAQLVPSATRQWPKDAPWYGEIEWPGSTDKLGRTWTTPINELARAALDRVLEQRPAFNLDGYLFPSPRKPGEPIRGDVTSKWLKQAEKLAGVPKQDGSLWHAYRRLWATERKDLPVQDVAQAEGWKDLKTLQTVYQQADTATTYAVVTHRSRERDQKVETRCRHSGGCLPAVVGYREETPA